MIEIETSRLLLRKFEENDRSDMFAILSDEQGCLDDGGYHAYEQMNGEFEDLFQMFLEQQRYAIVLKAENKTIGILNMMEETGPSRLMKWVFVLTGTISERVMPMKQRKL